VLRREQNRDAFIRCLLTSHAVFSIPHMLPESWWNHRHRDRTDGVGIPALGLRAACRAGVPAMSARISEHEGPAPRGEASLPTLRAGSYVVVGGM
jgi:hypothetical protein